MRTILFLTLFILSSSAFADKSTYECMTGVREVYRGNMEKPISSENFVACHKMNKIKHKAKK